MAGGRQKAAVGGVRGESCQPTLGMDLGSCHQGKSRSWPWERGAGHASEHLPDRRLLQQLQRVSSVMNSDLFSQIAS